MFITHKIHRKYYNRFGGGRILISQSIQDISRFPGTLCKEDRYISGVRPIAAADGLDLDVVYYSMRGLCCSRVIYVGRLSV